MELTKKGHLGVNIERAAHILATQQVSDLYVGVREYVQNSKDSHANEIKLVFAPRMIAVGDTGDGMSRKEVEDSYLVFFDSAKGEGDIGQMGIGGKALIGHGDVESVHMVTVSKETGERTEVVMYMEGNLPTYEIKPTAQCDPTLHGTRVWIDLTEHADYASDAMAERIALDTITLQPHVTVCSTEEEREMDGAHRTRSTSQIIKTGGVDSLKSFAKGKRGAYYSNNYVLGEAAVVAAVKLEHSAAAVPFRTCMYTTVFGLGVSESNMYYFLSPYAMFVNLFGAKRVISSADIVDADKRRAFDIGINAFAVFALKELAKPIKRDAIERTDQLENNKRIVFDLMHLIMRRRDFYTLADIIDILPVGIKEARLFDGNFDGADSVSPHDLRMMEMENGGYIYYLPKNESTDKANKLAKANIPFISDKLLYSFLENLSGPHQVSMHLENIAETDHLYGRDADLNVKKFVDADPKIEKTIVGAIKDEAERVGIDLHDRHFGVKKFYDMLPGRHEDFDENTSTMACNAAGDIVINIGSDTVWQLYNVIISADGELKHRAVFGFIMDVVSHELAHDNWHNHSEEFYRAKEEICQGFLRKVMFNSNALSNTKRNR